MPRPGPETAVARPRSAPPRARRARGESRLGLVIQTLAMFLQIAWFTLRGWTGAAITLLPLVLAGAPTARRLPHGAPRIHLIPEPAAEER